MKIVLFFFLLNIGSVTHGPCKQYKKKIIQKIHSFQSLKYICIQSVSLRENNLAVSVAATIEALSHFFCTPKNIAKHFRI